ncbi:MAG: hypothetical protein EP330_17145 [Deltaproteobacteria bacterium]|nr:MAG: hypothetical protein EP330_17145 [Deltaproteobacteria bacterium]
MYQGRHYLTAPQFADVVGDGPTASLLFLERRRQNRAAAIFVLGGSVILTTGSYLVLLGAIVAFDTPTLGATMAVAGGAMMLGGAAAYYATLAILLLRAPRRNRVDLYYQRDDAEDWVESYNASLSPPIEVRAVVGPGALGIEARF